MPYSYTQYFKKASCYSLAFLLFIIPAVLSAQSTLAATVTLRKQVTLMGSVFEITIREQDSLQAAQRIEEAIAEIERIENLISEWRPQTQISEVNRQAGIQPVKVDKEVFELTKRAIQYSEMTDGAFDISIVAMDKIWVFDGSMDTMPAEEDIRNSVRLVNYKDIVLDEGMQTIFLKNKGMKIGFGSIGKGYAADKARAYLQAKKVPAGIVNASGDIATWGLQGNGKPWLIGINNPFKAHRILKTLKMVDAAVTTSGSYEKYAAINGQHYAHIINPKTGMPASGLTSVTVYGPKAEFANALSTSIMVLGPVKGIALLKKYKNYSALIMNDKGRVIKSK